MHGRCSKIGNLTCFVHVLKMKREFYYLINHNVKHPVTKPGCIIVK